MKWINSRFNFNWLQRQISICRDLFNRIHDFNKAKYRKLNKNKSRYKVINSCCSRKNHVSKSWNIKFESFARKWQIFERKTNNFETNFLSNTIVRFIYWIFDFFQNKSRIKHDRQIYWLNFWINFKISLLLNITFDDILQSCNAIKLFANDCNLNYIRIVIISRIKYRE